MKAMRYHGKHDLRVEDPDAGCATRNCQDQS